MQTRLYPNHQRQRQRQRQAGFSLIEILIVIALISILATVTITNVGGIFEGGKEKAAAIFVKQNSKAGFVTYKLDVGNYPSTEEGIAALVKAPSGKEARWKGPYLEEVPLDPWSNPYQYRFPGSKNVNGPRGYDIWSLGPDGAEGGDDIGNW